MGVGPDHARQVRAPPRASEDRFAGVVPRGFSGDVRCRPTASTARWASKSSQPTPEWDQACKIALCAASTHLSLVRHFNWVHLAGGAQLAIATRNSLPQDHPLFRLLWPYIYGTLQSNDMVTRGQMARGGDFETTFSFTFKGMCELFDDTYEQYQHSVNDPEKDGKFARCARRELRYTDAAEPGGAVRRHAPASCATIWRFTTRGVPPAPMTCTTTPRSWPGSMELNRLRSQRSWRGPAMTSPGTSSRGCWQASCTW